MMNGVTRRDAVKTAATAAAGLAALGGSFAFAQTKNKKKDRGDEKQWTFEEIDALMKEVELPSENELQELESAPEADVIEEICKIYKAVRPILSALDSLPFIPSSWKKVIKTFVSLMDLLCPPA